jgi:hypothetical protein
MYNHISWVEDAIVIVFPQHKSDQEGTRSLPKHAFANTAEPSICPILSFGNYLFTRGYDREGSKRSLRVGSANGLLKYVLTMRFC